MYAYVTNNPLYYVDSQGLDKAIIFWGSDYKEGHDKNNFYNKAIARQQELIESGEYEDGVSVVNGSKPEYWKNELESSNEKSKDISLMIYYGHADADWGLTLGRVEEVEEYKIWTLALPGITLDQYYNDKGVNIGSDMAITSLPTERLTNNAQIYLLGCNTATGGQMSIANIFSQHFKSATFGVMGESNYYGPGEMHIKVDRWESVKYFV